jgi:REP element-mobilizing transposase RayT
MPQSLAVLHVHLIFSTKDRAPFLLEGIRGDLHAYLSGILEEIGCHVVLVNSMEDHVHVLFNLGRTVAISQAVEALKTGSSKWLKPRDPKLARFAWQAGYAAFAVSESNLAAVREYISNQAEHHRKKSFQDEIRAFLDRHRVTYEEKYVWD